MCGLTILIPFVLTVVVDSSLAVYDFAIFDAMKLAGGKNPACCAEPPDKIESIATKSMCAIRCETLADCVGFNFKKNLKTCEIYLQFSPCAFEYQSECMYYKKQPEFIRSSAFLDDFSCENVVRPEICSFPNIFDGSVYYSCFLRSDLASPQLSGCFNKTGAWKFCGRPTDYSVQHTVIDVTSCNSTSPVLSINNWIIFLHRFNDSVSFNRSWANYSNGFGNLEGEFWLGLEKIYQLTKCGSWSLRIEILDNTTNLWIYIEYGSFVIMSESKFYSMSVATDGSGTAPNLFNFADSKRHSGMNFTTYDGDHDQFSGGNCATNYAGGFWYNSCWAFCPTCSDGTNPGFKTFSYMRSNTELSPNPISAIRFMMTQQ